VDGAPALSAQSVTRLRSIRGLESRLFPSGFRLLAPVFSPTMFETIAANIATAADKLAHLRRFL